MEIWKKQQTASCMHRLHNKIERGWRELLERMEQYVKQQLHELMEEGEYDPDDSNDR